MAHTPGPWVASGGYIGTDKELSTIIATVWNAEDAPVLAAAPLLLAALKAVEWVDGPETAPGMGGMMEQVCPWCDKVAGDDWAHNPGCIRQAAIAAARGK